MRPAELFSADQWIGTNTEPGCCPSLGMTRSSAAPCSVSTRASMPCSRPSAAASSGMHLDERLGDVRGKARR